MPIDYKTEFQRYKRYYQELSEVSLKPKNRLYGTAVFSFLAVSLFGWYAIRPTVQTILFLRREIKDNQIVSQKMEEKISNLVEAQSSYQEVTPNLPVVSQALPQSPDVLTLVAQLRNLATSTQASLSAVQVPTVPLLGYDASRSGQVKTATLGEYPIAVSLSGPFTSIRSFLDGIVAMRRIAAIDTILIAPSKDTSSGTTKNFLLLTLKLKAYYMLP